MKGKDWVKLGVFVMAYVVVVGFAGASGVVYGQQSDTSGISANASETRVDVWDFSIDDNWNTTIISENNSAVTFPHTVNNASQVSEVFISLKVYDSQDVSQNISDAKVWINSTRADGTDAGDAVFQYNNQWSVTETGTEAYLNITWSAADNDPFLLIGNWQIESKITNSTVGTIDRADFGDVTDDNVDDPFDVALYRSISASGGSTTISGTAAPGETLTTNSSLNSGEVQWDSADTVEFSINDDYELEAHVTDLEHTTQSYIISSENWDTDYGVHNETTNPTNLETFDPLGTTEGYYSLDIPAGQEPGEYTGTITHYVNQTT